MIAWLRQHSTVVHRLSPPAEVFVVCRGCGTRQFVATDYTAPASLAGDIDGDLRHAIGDVFTSAGQLTKYCDGTEEA